MKARTIFLLAAHAALAGAASAQVTISGNVFDGNGGPLLSGVVYHAQSKLVVPAGETLTVHPGAILKFKTNLDWYLRADGVLDVDGTALEPVIFTSILDDTAGGDTALDGPTVGALGDWGGLTSGIGGLIDAEHAEVRFAGFGGLNAVRGLGGSVDLRNCTIRDSANEGISFSGAEPPFVRIEDCAILDCEDYALDDVPIDAVPGIKNNTASGNGVDAIRVPNANTVGSTIAIGPENCLNGALVIDGVLAVEPGTELILAAGTVMKVDQASSTRWVVEGTLRLQGTAADPVVVTSIGDDDHGGDTLGDGPTDGAPGDWTGIRSLAGGTLVADHALIRYGGKTGESTSSMAIRASGGAITLRDCELRDNERSAVDAANSTAPLVIERCSFADNEQYPITGLPWGSLPGLWDNSASGNGLGNYPSMVAGVTSDVEVRARNQFGGAIVWRNQLNVSAGATLTLHKGVVLKTDDNDAIDVAGTLVVLGTPHEPVVMTTIEDDEYAGDTNGGGPSAGLTNSWEGVVLDPGSGASFLRNLRVRYAGLGQGALWVRSPLAELRSVRAEHADGDGFHVDDAAILVNCVAFANTQEGFELDGGSFDVVHATAAGNGGDGIKGASFHTGTVRSSVSWGNGGDNFADLAPGELVSSCGDPASDGIDGNLFADPLFANEAGGDLRLSAGSPCVDAADLAVALPLVFDAQDHSRVLPGAPFGAALPDMGAFELAYWVLWVTGSAAVGESLTLETIGEAGTALYAFGFLDDTLFIPPYGFLTAGVATLTVLPGSTPVNTQLVAPISPSAALVGVDFGLQAVGLSSVSPGFLHFTNLYRGRFEAEL
ncbi:MAG: right-handed parallel beta-helix repeat-containing protein [Planctomycetota bacterium]